MCFLATAGRAERAWCWSKAQVIPCMATLCEGPAQCWTGVFTCMFPPSISALWPVEEEAGQYLLLFCLPCNWRMSFCRKVSLCQAAFSSSKFTYGINFKCISPFRISTLCQWDGTGLLLSLKCGNLSSHLLDELHVGWSKCNLISPDCLLSVVYLIL